MILFLLRIKKILSFFIPWQGFLEFGAAMLFMLLQVLAIEAHKNWAYLSAVWISILWWFILDYYRENSFRFTISKWQEHLVTKENSKVWLSFVFDKTKQRLLEVWLKFPKNK